MDKEFSFIRNYTKQPTRYNLKRPFNSHNKSNKTNDRSFPEYCCDIGLSRVGTFVYGSIFFIFIICMTAVITWYITSKNCN